MLLSRLLFQVVAISVGLQTVGKVWELLHQVLKFNVGQLHYQIILRHTSDGCGAGSLGKQGHFSEVVALGQLS